MAEAAYSCKACDLGFSLAAARESDFLCNDCDQPLKRMGKVSSVDLGSPMLKGDSGLGSLFRQEAPEPSPVPAAKAVKDRPEAVRTAEPPRRVSKPVAKKRSDPEHSPVLPELTPAAEPDRDRAAAQRGVWPAVVEPEPKPKLQLPRVWVVRGVVGVLVLILLVMIAQAYSGLGDIEDLAARLGEVEEQRPELTRADTAQQERIAALTKQVGAMEERLAGTLTKEQFSERYRDEIPEMVDRCSTALVHIVNKRRIWKNGRMYPRNSAGSGFIIESGGTTYVVTNYHVVQRAQVVDCHLYNKHEIKAVSVHGSDPVSDISLLSINLQSVPGADKIQPAKLSTSGSLRPGDGVIALGSPKGLARSVTLGIVSNSQRYRPWMPMPEVWSSTGIYNNWIQVDTPINPGNSGGPLLNLKGAVVGVVTRKISQAGVDNIGFAVPIDYVKAVLDQLIQNKRVRRSTIGVFIAPYNPLIGATGGVRILDVIPGSPADRAGIMRNDLMTRFNGKPITARYWEDLAGVSRQLALAPLKSVEVELLRDGGKVTKRVRPRVRTEADGQIQHFAQLGFFARQVTPALKAEQNLKNVKGVWVCGVQLNTLFAKNGFHRGDVIRGVQGKAINTMQEAWTLFHGLLQKRTTPLKIVFVRNGQQHTKEIFILYSQ